MVEPHWTDTAHLFRDCYTNSINIENPHNLNDTDVPTEESRINPKRKTPKKFQKIVLKNKDHKVTKTNMNLIN